MKVKRKLSESLLGDVIRKAAIGGGLPSDVKRVVVDNIESLRESAVDIFAQEVSKVLSRLDVQRIADDVFRNYTLHLEAKLELKPKKKGRGK